MTFASRTLGLSASFVPITHTYTTGSGTETPPAGASSVTATCQGDGSGGYFSLSTNLPGGAGGEAIKTTTTLTGNFTWSVGPGSAANSNLPGSGTTITGNGINLNARGGGNAFGGGLGGIATGGDTNVTGGSAHGNAGGTSPNTPAGDGGSPLNAGNAGLVKFAYT